MRKTVFLLLIMLFSLTIFAQDTFEEKIQWIRNHYYRIEGDIAKNNEKKVYTVECVLLDPDDEYNFFDVYIKDGKIEKLKLVRVPKCVEGNKYKEVITSYYFYESRFFFMYREISYKDGFYGDPYQRTEERYYIYDDEIIRAIMRTGFPDAIGKLPQQDMQDVLNNNNNQGTAILNEGYNALTFVSERL